VLEEEVEDPAETEVVVTVLVELDDSDVVEAAVEAVVEPPLTGELKR
jgi:hypothetical protein